MANFQRGSSPLTRGKRVGRDAHHTPLRLIPAHAGKTARRASSPQKHAAHPRSRGENTPCPSARLPLRGSSPLTRGKPRPRDNGRTGSSPLTRGKRRTRKSCGCRGGLIPAHAGKTRAHPHSTHSDAAHPRSRGENRRFRHHGRVRVGSSPLTRGKPHSICGHHHRNRLIPAHAGKTRWRGLNPLPPPGSSPLTRGKPGTDISSIVVFRLIPAHAGKTGRWRGRRLPGRAHPRSRGENIRAALGEFADDGSSPLTRGKPSDPIVCIRRTRLIPAHAGKTVNGVSSLSATTAHPRSRGENCR